MLNRLLESVHGHLGVLAAAALLHPAFLLRQGRPLTPGTRLSVVLTGLVTSAAYGLGLWLYDAYRAEVKRRLFLASFDAGLLFETKEHLAFAVLTLTVGATIAALVAPREASGTRRLAAAAFATAALLCLATVALGTYVASIRAFPEP